MVWNAADAGNLGVLCFPIPPLALPGSPPELCPHNASENLKPLRPALSLFQCARVSSHLTAVFLSLAPRSTAGCQPCHTDHARALLVTAGDIHENQTAWKINFSFIFLLVMQQPSAAAFALQLHLSILGHSWLPGPRGAGAVLQVVHLSRSPWTHLPCGKHPAAGSDGRCGHGTPSTSQGLLPCQAVC